MALDVRASLLENLLAVTLLRHYGTKDMVYYYNHGVEVDFYIPDEEIAIQSCYSMDKSDDTFEREVKALIKIQKHLSCRRNIIVTYDSEETIIEDGIEIEVIPAWKFIRGW
ncbi:ATP-binding protein [Proteiniphilum sp. X52]|nr:ATP-binding protein [Proteiniphilum sp. X52]